MISQLFNNVAHKHSDRTALVDGDRHITYFELQVYVEWIARYFQSLGVQPGHRIAIYMPNQHEFVISLFGMLPLGGVAVPLPLRDKPEDIRAALLAAKAHALITIPKYRDTLSAVLSQSGKTEWPLHKIPLAVFEEDNIATANGALLPPEASAKFAVTTNGKDQHAGIGFLSGLAGRFDEHNAVTFLQTGNAGAPVTKAYTHRALADAAESFVRSSQMSTEDCILAVLPFSQTHGLINGLLAAITCGAKTILLARFDEASVARTLVDEHVTIWPGLPAMFTSMLRAHADPERLGHSLRLCYSAGASLAPECNEDFRREFGVAVQPM